MNSGAKVIFFTRNITDVFLYHELSNFFSHGMSRNITDVFLYHELSNYRIHDKIYKSVMLRDNPCEENNSQIR